MIETEVPGGSKGLAVRDERAKGAGHRSAEAVVPVVELVNRERGSNKRGAKERRDRKDHFPVPVNQLSSCKHQREAYAGRWLDMTFSCALK